VQLIFWISSKT